MTSEQIGRNPDVDYTMFGLVPFLFLPQSDGRPQTRLDLPCLFRCRRFDTGGCEPILSWDVRGFMTAISDGVVAASSSYDQYISDLFCGSWALKLSHQKSNLPTTFKSVRIQYVQILTKASILPSRTSSDVYLCSPVYEPMVRASVAYLYRSSIPKVYLKSTTLWPNVFEILRTGRCGEDMLVHLGRGVLRHIEQLLYFVTL